MSSRPFGGALAALLLLVAWPAAAQCPAPTFDGGPDFETEAFGLYYVLTGGKFPTGNIPNGDNGSGGTFRFLLDDPAWGGYPLGTWTRDDWFPENAGLALTLVDGGTIVYDNNGIEDGTHGGFYDYTGHPEDDYAMPGLYRGYSMSNNFDWIYAGYFYIETPTTFDQIIGYFDTTGGSSMPLVLDSPAVRLDMNIWSGLPTPVPNRYMPACDSFTGDVFASTSVPGSFSWSETDVDRVFPDWLGYAPDGNSRLVYTLDEAFTLEPGHYFFSHSMTLLADGSIDLRPHQENQQVNTSSHQLVPIAILGTELLDVTTIDESSVDVRGAGVVRSKVQDVNGDAFLDLVVHVRANEMDPPTEAECAGPAELVLQATYGGGSPFQGSDLATFIGPDCD